MEMGGLYSVGTSAVFEFDANAYGNMFSGCNEDMLGDGGTDPGTINGVNQFYIQNRKGVDHPNYCVSGQESGSITHEFCAGWIGETKDGTNFKEKGGMKVVG